MKTSASVSELTSYALLALILAAGPALAEKKYGPGVTDTEIKIGQTAPFSGPMSAFATIVRAEAAYFAKVNAEGGVNGRKIKLVSLDDAYSPPKTVEQTRRLVEQDEVFLLFSSLGTAPNAAIQRYLNTRKVPHLFVASIDAKFSDPTHFPWSMGWPPTVQIEAPIYARFILANSPNARIAVLYQNDDVGKDALRAFKAGLGDKAGMMVVAEASYEVADPTVDSQVVTLKGSGADVFINFSGPKFAAQAIRKVYDIGWRPLHILLGSSRSVSSVLRPAGLDKSAGIITSAYLKDPSDPSWKDDPSMKEFLVWLAKYYPDGDPGEYYNVSGYSYAQTLVQVLKQCGDDLTRENVMRQAANLKNLELPMLLPGIRINTSQTDYLPIKQLRLQRFDGKQWVLFGEVIGN
jgi:ABC-type branched-subunit amino acid transport system substrate-binding protein